MGSIKQKTLTENMEHPLMVCWVIGSIPHGGPIELFLVPTSAPQLCYHVCRMVHIKEPLLLTGKNSLYSGGSRFPLTQSEWSFTISPTPYNHK